MADIGDKAFTTELVQEIKAAVLAELGSNAYVKRHLATVTSVDTTTSEVIVRISGMDSDSIGFYARGLQLPVAGDSVIACIDGQDRWIESVVRPATSTPYLQISSGSLIGAGAPTGAIVAWSMVNPPAGWLICNGQTVSRTTYASLFAVIGISYGNGDGSTTFGLPDLQGRFLGANVAHTTQPTKNTGTLGPNSTWSAPAHTHTTGIGHGHGFDSGAHTHTGPSHDHGAGQLTTTASATATSGGTAGNSASAQSHTHGVGGTTANAGTGATSGATYTTNPSVTALGTTSVTSSGASATSIGTPSSFLANFIIKT